MHELSISQKYPATQYNLLGNTDVIVDVPEIKSPVIQVVHLNPDPKKKDVYIQQKASREYTDGKGNCPGPSQRIRMRSSKKMLQSMNGRRNCWMRHMCRKGSTGRWRDS